MKLETTPEERLYWPHHPDAQADVARAARDISTLLARNEALEQALRERSVAFHKDPCRTWNEHQELAWGDCPLPPCKSDRALINGEGK